MFPLPSGGNGTAATTKTSVARIAQIYGRLCNTFSGLSQRHGCDDIAIGEYLGDDRRIVNCTTRGAVAALKWRGFRSERALLGAS